MNKKIAVMLVSLTAIWTLSSSAYAKGGDDDSSSSSSGQSSSASSSAGSHSSTSSGQSSSGASSHRSSSSAQSSSAASVTARLRLRPTAGSTTSARGWAEYRTGLPHKEQRFRINVKVPLPSTFPAVLDTVSAQALAVEAILIRRGRTIAQCTLEVDDSAIDSNNQIHAEYKVDLRARRKKLFQTKAGGCVDPTSGSPSMPNLRSSDVVEISTDGTDTFLTGTLR